MWPSSRPLKLHASAALRRQPCTRRSLLPTLVQHARIFCSSPRRSEELLKEPEKEPVKTIPYSEISIGVPTEVRTGERRVAITPQNAALLLKKGFKAVLVEHGAGFQAQFEAHDYEKAGATMVNATRVWTDSDIVLKVRPPRRTARRLLGCCMPVVAASLLLSLLAALLAQLRLAPKFKSCTDVPDQATRGGVPRLKM